MGSIERMKTKYGVGCYFLQLSVGLKFWFSFFIDR